MESTSKSATLNTLPPELLAIITSYLRWKDIANLIDTLDQVLWMKLVRLGGIASVVLTDKSRKALHPFAAVPLLPRVWSEKLGSRRTTPSDTSGQAPTPIVGPKLRTNPRAISRTPFSALQSLAIITSDLFSVVLAALPPTLTSIELHLNKQDLLTLLLQGTVNFDSSRPASSSCPSGDHLLASSTSSLKHAKISERNSRRFDKLFPGLRYLSLRSIPVGPGSHGFDFLLPVLLKELPTTLQGFDHNLWPLDQVLNCANDFPPSITTLSSHFLQYSKQYPRSEPSPLLRSLHRLEMPYLDIIQAETLENMCGPNLEWLCVHQLDPALLPKLSSLKRLALLENPFKRFMRSPTEAYPKLEHFEFYSFHVLKAFIPSLPSSLTYFKYRAKEQTICFLTLPHFLEMNLEEAASNLQVLDLADCLVSDRILPHLPESITHLKISSILMHGELPSELPRSREERILEIEQIIEKLHCIVTFHSKNRIIFQKC